MATLKKKTATPFSTLTVRLNRRSVRIVRFAAAVAVIPVRTSCKGEGEKKKGKNKYMKNFLIFFPHTLTSILGISRRAGRVS